MKLLKLTAIFTLFTLSVLTSSCSEGAMGEAGFYDDNNSRLNMRNWKWYEYKKECYTLYSDSSDEVQSITKHTGIQLPFFEGSGPAGRDLYRADRNEADMYPEDGWVLITADFGSNTKAPGMPYFILYNRATGILRYFFYYPLKSRIYTYAAVKLEQLHGKSSMFSFYDNLKCFADDYDSDKTLATMTELSCNSWSYADFVISFDPSVETQTGLSFYISVYGVNRSDILLNGSVAPEQILSRGQMHSSGSSGLGDIITAGRQVYSYFKSSESFLNYCSLSTGNWYSGILKSAASGGKALYEESVAGRLGGIFSSGILSSRQSQPIPFSLQNEASLKVSLTRADFLDGFTLNVPGAITNADDPDLLSYYTKPLGVFSIKSKPVLDITVTTTEEGTDYRDYKVNFKVTSIKLNNNAFPGIVFNNIDGYYIDSVALGYVFSNETPIVLGYNGFATEEKVPFRLHQNYPVEFSVIENFQKGYFNYSAKALIIWPGFEGYTTERLLYFYTVDYSFMIKSIKNISKIVAPEIAVKVTMYSSDDIAKQNPIVHLKRVKADYNICWFRTKTGYTSNLGFFTN